MSSNRVSRIFVVDDEPIIASTLAIILNTNGYSARWFTRATEALTAAQFDNPDLLISDVAMPGLSGVDLAIQMKARFPKCKILLFSGQATRLDLLGDACSQDHEFLVLSKPMHPTELLYQIGTIACGEQSLQLEARAKYPAAPKQAPGIHTTLMVDALSKTPGKDLDDFAARNRVRLIEYLPIVSAVARRIYGLVPEPVSYRDLYGAGLAGLMGALNQFDLFGEIRFPSYARFEIRKVILDNLQSLVRNAEGLRRKGKPIEEAIHTLTSQLEGFPSELERSQKLSLDLAAYHRLLNELRGIEISALQKRCPQESGKQEAVNLGNMCKNEPQSSFQRAKMQRRLADAIRELPDRERLVLNLAYHEGLTLKNIGFVLDEAESRASQIHASAVLRLRSKLSEFGFT